MHRALVGIPVASAYIAIWLFASVFAAQASYAQGANTRYVRPNAPAGGNGTSWATAYNNLKTALNAVQSNPAVTQVWVAKGTYYPGTTRFNLRNNLALYGGFLGNETQLSQRNIALHETSLTGQGEQGIINGGTTNATAVVDGFTIRDGNALRGGAVEDGGSTYRSCKFIDNFAMDVGGAYSTYQGSPSFLNCIFIGNEALAGGSAIILSANNIVNFTVRNCVFENNTTNPVSQVIYYEGGTGSIVNCDFRNNTGAAVETYSGTLAFHTCRVVGGTAEIAAVNSYGGTVTITNSVIAGNSGASVYMFDGTLVIRNSTIVSDGAPAIDVPMGSNPTIPVIRNSVIAGGTLPGSSDAQYSCLPFPIAGAGNVTGDPRFVNPQAGDWRLGEGSPAIDSGDSTSLTADTYDLDGDGNIAEQLPLDASGRVRRYDTEGVADTGVGPAPVVDMGAIEHFPDCNNNLILDATDIAQGTSADLDSNGVPDECEDCNLNGLPDGIDIANGTSTDCDEDETPDECENEDCNGNGVPDSCDIDAGTAGDCNANGVPDECDLVANADEILYSRAEGAAETNIGNLTIRNFIWFTSFQVEQAGEVLRAVEVAFGAGTPVGTPATVHVWTDPDGDGIPDDAVRRVSVPVSVTAPGTSTYLMVDVPDVYVGSEGSWFFVGVETRDVPTPAPLDRGVTQRNSWVASASHTVDVDPDDLNTADFLGLVDSFSVAGEWLIRAIGSRDLDCDGNGIIDGCKVGSFPDCNGNLISDACELDFNDCNSNGLPDGCDIAGGLEGDCQQNGVPDSCEIKSGLESDVDANGVPDSCEDCNANGIPDGVDILSGLSEDCQPDGTPDECQLPYEELRVYSYDDGDPETTLGVGAAGNFGWLNHFTVEEGMERIVSVEIMFGIVPLGRPHFIAVWSDPDGDGEPYDAEVLALVEVGAVATGSTTFTRVDLPDVVVGPPGSGFFVGAIANNLATSGEFPAALDRGLPIYRSWALVDGSPIDPMNPTEGVDAVILMDEYSFGLFRGRWLVRALAEAISDCNANNQPDDCDIADGTSFDANGNGQPDECEGCLYDIDGDGAVGAGDLAMVLGDWGGPSKSADVNDDGTVDAADLSLILGSWGACK
jgi:hypothetical protein